MLSYLHRLFIIAFGLLGLTLAAPVLASAQGSPQIVSVTTSAHGLFSLGAPIDIYVTFDAEVAVTGTPTIALNNGGTAHYVSGDQSNTLVFRYTPSLGVSILGLNLLNSNALSLNGGTITDIVNSVAAGLSTIGLELGSTGDSFVDTTPPVATFTANNGAHATNNRAVSLVFTYLDDVTVSGEVYLSLDGVAWGSSQPVEPTTYSLPDEDGSYTIYAKFRDEAGNETAPVSQTIVLDRIAPAAPVMTPSTTDRAQEVTVTIVFSGDTVVKRYQLWGDNIAEYTGPFVLTSNRTISAYATDEAGNQSNAVLYVENIDHTPPTVTATINSGALWTKDAVVTLSFNDGGTGATGMRFYSDAETVWSDWEPYSPTRLYALSEGDGEKTVHMQFQDDYGNEGAAISLTINLDKTPPVAAMMINDGAQLTDSREVTLGLFDDNSGAMEMQFSEDGITWTDWEAYSETKAFTLPDGNGVKTIYAKVKDAVGNESDPINASIVLDVPPPPNQPPVMTSHDGTAVVNLDREENTTAVTTITAEDPEGEFTTFVISGGSDQAKFSIDAVTGVLVFLEPQDYENPSDTDANNSYEVEVTAIDKRGGTATQTIIVHLIKSQDELAAAAVIEDIDLLPSETALTLADKTAVEAARAAYDNLMPIQQSLVTNSDTLLAAEAVIQALENATTEVAILSAFGDAAGDAITLRVSSELDGMHAMEASRFQIIVNGAVVTAAEAAYDPSDASGRTIQLWFSSPVLLHATSASITVQSGAFRTSTQYLNGEIPYRPMNTFKSLDITQDNRIGVDDIAGIILNPDWHMDVNADGLFDQEDVQMLLSQISPVSDTLR
ncbi:cadherin repeat domain-containing protein [Paenibacillus oryzisoli]|uniref:cadherin repeat domain-containing protein n=1 Tax=Paenibacillus oryzisoli TaxID=1850517 RepID=UPI003D26EA6D